MTDEQRMEDAKQYVARLEGFYIHAAVYALVNLVLLVLNVWLGPPYWVVWVLLGWGVGLAGHAVAVFGRGFSFATAWKERKLKEYLDRTPKA